MPTRKIEAVALPYAGKRYTPNLLGMAELYRRTGESLADLSLRKGDIAAGTLGKLGALYSNFRAEGLNEQARKEALALRREDAAARKAEQEADRAERKAEREAIAVERQSMAQQRFAEAQAKALDAEGERVGKAVDKGQPGVSPVLYDLAQKFPEVAARFQVLDGVPVLMRTPEQARQAALDASMAADRTADNTARDAAAAEAKRHNQVMEARPVGGAGVRQPIWVVGADGKFQDLAGVAPPGSKPANTREQGRPVTSGDAGRVADFDTSLDDLKVLDQTVSGSTGTIAKIGAALPNWVTNLTGRGISAKQKQASIDRVKQVIGKALEGGVLRKEDEVKYEKILPTIYDEPQVVTSKLAGLRDALTLRRQTLLDSLADAGYDVSRYNQRAGDKAGAQGSNGPAIAKDDAVDALIKKYGGG